MIEPVIFEQHGKKIIIQRIFNKCNNRCIFCCNCIPEKDRNRKMTTEEAFGIIDSYPSDIDTIAFTTTEPTVRKDFFDILRYTRKKLPDAEIQIMTNGRMFSYAGYTMAFRDLGLDNIKICVPIHAHNAKEHNLQTMVPGSFLQTIKGIRNLLNYTNYLIEIRVLVNGINYKHMEKIAEFIKTIDPRLNRIVFVYISITGRAEKKSRILNVKFSKSVPHLLRAVDILEKDFDIGIYHVPLCVLPRKYRKYTRGMTVQNNRLLFPSVCKKCNAREQCSGLWNYGPSMELVGDLKPIKEQLPEEVRVELTKRCNLDCSFCFNKNNAGAVKNELSTKQIFSVIDNIKNSGIESVRFTGGEPFLMKDLEVILKYAKSKGLYIILNTNGTLINDKNIKFLKHVDDTLVSSHDLENTEKKTELFEKIKKEKPNIILRACTIATKENIKNLEKFYKFFEAIPVDDWFLLRPVPIPENKRPINQKDMKELVEKILKLNKKYRVKTHIANALPFCSYEPDKVGKVCVGGRNDNGHTRIVIDSEANIKPSYFIDKKLGDATKDSLLQAWNSRFMQDLRHLKTIPGACMGCNYLNKCMGGLRFAAENNMDYLMEEALPDIISIIVPTYNRKETLKTVLTSAFRQNYPSDRMEIIVADDGSTDGTSDMVRKLKENSPVKLSYFKQKHMGFRAGAARNLGAKKAKGDVLVFINDDIFLDKNFIRNHIFSLKNSDIVLGYCASYGNKHWYSKPLRDRLTMEKDVPVIPEFRDSMFNSANLRNSNTNSKIWHVFLAANFSIKRSIFLKHMFDERFTGWGCEDVELGYRLFKAGYRIIMDKGCLGIHITHEERGIYSGENVVSLLRGFEKFYKLHPNEEVRRCIIDRCMHLPDEFKNLSKEK